MLVARGPARLDADGARLEAYRLLVRFGSGPLWRVCNHDDGRLSRTRRVSTRWCYRRRRLLARPLAFLAGRPGRGSLSVYCDFFVAVAAVGIVALC